MLALMMTKLRAISLVTVALLFLGCERMETVETVYPNFEAAAKAKAIGNGRWIPGFLPPSAADIREVHNLDTNEVWLFFRSNSTDLPAVVSLCKKVAGREVVYPRKSPGSWWPQMLIKRHEDSQQVVNAYEYYQCKEGKVMAIDRSKSEVYFWDLG